MKEILIGLTGQMGSGKGEIIKILEMKGFRKISLSDMVRAEVKRQGRDVNRSEMQDIGNSLRKVGGAGILGKLVKESIEKSEYTKWVIDGIRNPAEIEHLRQLDCFSLIGVKASVSVLLNRIKNRRRDTDRMTDTEIKKVLEREWGIGEPYDGQRVGACIQLSDYMINNEGSLEQLTLNITNVLEKIGVRYE